MLKGAAIVFDLDGTLVDTAPDLTSALNHVLTPAAVMPQSRPRPSAPPSGSASAS